MKSGEQSDREKHGLQARIAGWREDAAAAKAPAKKREQSRTGDAGANRNGQTARKFR